MSGARKRAAEARRASYNGVISINGTEYEAAIRSSPASLQLEEGGQRPIESLTARVLKEDLPVNPAIETMIQALGRDWILREVGGREGWSVEWVLTATRD